MNELIDIPRRLLQRRKKTVERNRATEFRRAAKKWKRKSLSTAKWLVLTYSSDRECIMPLTWIFLPITFETAGRYGTGKGPGVIGYGQQQRCGRDEALRLRHELLLHRIATRASPEDRRVEETVVVLWHLFRKLAPLYGSRRILETRISQYVFIVSLMTFPSTTEFFSHCT